jgi:tRNA-uridine 2-sulfurtransferase
MRSLLYLRSIQKRTQSSVAVALSGGIDSAVSALLLKEQGYDVVGVFMQNWDNRDERGQDCPSTEDYQDAKDICRRLKIDFHEVFDINLCVLELLEA